MSNYKNTLFFRVINEDGYCCIYSWAQANKIASVLNISRRLGMDRKSVYMWLRRGLSGETKCLIESGTPQEILRHPCQHCRYAKVSAGQNGEASEVPD